jgi:hypothetical protein
MATKKTEKKARKAKKETVKNTKAGKPAKKTATEEKNTVKETAPRTIQEDLSEFLKPFVGSDWSEEDLNKAKATNADLSSTDDLKKIKTGVAKIVKKYFPPTENHTFIEVYIPKSKAMSDTLIVFIGFRKLEDVSFNVFNCMVKLKGKKK